MPASVANFFVIGASLLRRDRRNLAQTRTRAEGEFWRGAAHRVPAGSTLREVGTVSKDRTTLEKLMVMAGLVPAILRNVIEIAGSCPATTRRGAGISGLRDAPPRLA